MSQVKKENADDSQSKLTDFVKKEVKTEEDGDSPPNKTAAKARGGTTAGRGRGRGRGGAASKRI